MSKRQRHNLRVISSVLVGIMAFIVGFLLTAFAGVFLLFLQQADFLLTGVIVAFVVICGIVGLALGVMAGVKYYRHQRNSD